MGGYDRNIGDRRIRLSVVGLERSTTFQSEFGGKVVNTVPALQRESAAGKVINTIPALQLRRVMSYLATHRQ